MSHIQSLNGRLFALIWACVRHLSSRTFSGAPADGGPPAGTQSRLRSTPAHTFGESFIGPCTRPDTHTQHVVHSIAVSTAAGLSW